MASSYDKMMSPYKYAQMKAAGTPEARALIANGGRVFPIIFLNGHGRYVGDDGSPPEFEHEASNFAWPRRNGTFGYTPADAATHPVFHGILNFGYARMLFYGRVGNPNPNYQMEWVDPIPDDYVLYSFERDTIYELSTEWRNMPVQRDLTPLILEKRKVVHAFRRLRQEIGGTLHTLRTALGVGRDATMKEDIEKKVYLTNYIRNRTAEIKNEIRRSLGPDIMILNHMLRYYQPAAAASTAAAAAAAASASGGAAASGGGGGGGRGGGGGGGGASRFILRM